MWIHKARFPVCSDYPDKTIYDVVQSFLAIDTVYNKTNKRENCSCDSQGVTISDSCSN